MTFDWEQSDVVSATLWWRHNGHNGVSNHQPHDCLPNRLFRRRSKKTSKLCITGLCVGNSVVPGEFPTQKASNAESVSLWCHHHELFSIFYSIILYNESLKIILVVLLLHLQGANELRPNNWYDKTLKWIDHHSYCFVIRAGLNAVYLTAFNMSHIVIWVRSRNCGCLVTWFCYQLIAKPGNKTAAVLWPDPYTGIILCMHPANERQR